MDINIEKIPKLQELITDQQDSIKQLEEKCTENKKRVKDLERNSEIERLIKE